MDQTTHTTFQDKNYAFVEFRSVEEASNCMAFDGLAFKDGYLRVRSEMPNDGSFPLLQQNTIFLIRFVVQTTMMPTPLSCLDHQIPTPPWTFLN